MSSKIKPNLANPNAVEADKTAQSQSQVSIDEGVELALIPEGGQSSQVVPVHNEMLSFIKEHEIYKNVFRDIKQNLVQKFGDYDQAKFPPLAPNDLS